MTHRKMKYTDWLALTEKKRPYSPSAAYCDAVVDRKTGKVVEVYTSSKAPQLDFSYHCHPVSIERHCISLRGLLK